MLLLAKQYTKKRIPIRISQLQVEDKVLDHIKTATQKFAKKRFLQLDEQKKKQFSKNIKEAFGIDFKIEQKKSAKIARSYDI